MAKGIFNGFAQRVLASAVCAFAFVSGGAQASPTRDLTAADITNSSTQFFNPGNSHIYEIVTTSLFWVDARDAAAAKSIAGVQGHLVTITGASEDAFVASALTGFRVTEYWFGASDAAVEGVWRWVVGPESGTQFWQAYGQGQPNYGGFAIGSAYTNWFIPYLDNLADDQAGLQLGADYGVIIPLNCENAFASGSCGKWGDANYLDLHPFIVEYSGPVADVPIPGTVALLGLGLVGIGAARRKQA
jgi:hypothetical protein